MDTESLLLAQIKSYTMLAKLAKLQYHVEATLYYMKRARQTMELYNAERQNRTGVYYLAA